MSGEKGSKVSAIVGTAVESSTPRPLVLGPRGKGLTSLRRHRDLRMRRMSRSVREGPGGCFARRIGL